MKGPAIAVMIFLFVVAMIVSDFFFAPTLPVREMKGNIPFSHVLHGANLGLDCSRCHTGSRLDFRAYMPSRSDCLDCHRIPVTESPEIARLDSLLQVVPEHPWSTESRLPSHVIFHHGIHARANVSCEVCHGSAEEIDRGRRAEVNMGECLACHRGERGFPKASTDCARCHR